MARPNTTLPSGVRHSQQNMQNWSFDDDFGLFMAESLVYNPAKDQMERAVVERKYEYMGKQTIGNYTYYGFKERGSVEWKVMRKDNTDDAAWQYAYSEASANDWTTAWATPGGESYGDPPDA